jgi:hypothetical protein
VTQIPARCAVGLLLVGCCVAACSSTSSTPGAPSPTSRTTSSSAATPSASSTVVSQAPVPFESNPPGDIPDNIAFVPYRNSTGRYRFVHPEGWAQVVHGTSVRFTDKLNGVATQVVTAHAAPSVAGARRDDVPRLRSSVPAFQLRSVSAVTLPGGDSVLIVFRRNSDPNPVTGRQYRDEVLEYLLWRGGHEIRFDLFGPVGADNVDAYRTMSDSLRLS